MKSVTLTIALIFFLTFFSNQNAVAQRKIEDEFQMKQYFMVFLKRGLNLTQDSATAAKIQEGHLNNITRLFNEKKLIVAGPFLDDGIYRGIFIFDIPTIEEVTQLLLTDPAIHSGRLDYEIHPWYGPGNISIGRKPE
jgi:uncharacterized protein YciI